MPSTRCHLRRVTKNSLEPLERSLPINSRLAQLLLLLLLPSLLILLSTISVPCNDALIHFLPSHPHHFYPLLIHIGVVTNIHTIQLCHSFFFYFFIVWIQEINNNLNNYMMILCFVEKNFTSRMMFEMF